VIRRIRRHVWLLPAALLAAILLLTLSTPALADTATPENPAGASADAIDNVYRAILGVTVTIFVLVAGWLLYSAIRFRERPGQDYEPPQVHGSTRLEIGWTIVPVLILVGLSAYTLDKLPSVRDAPANSMVVRVDAQQFTFTYTYPDGKQPSSPSTLVVPVDTPVKLELHAKDVIHDWWVPALGPKMDAIPGRPTSTWFKATRMGTFKGQCAEFCGTGHATMLIHVKVVSKDDFRTYMNGLGG
jgi:cytochrome c oxidase subunit II